jgi:hypothetical protein
VIENTAQAIERLEMEGATGCLVVHGPEAEARLYLIEGHVFHAEGPAGEGNAALAEALSWWEAPTSFDAEAKLPTEETINLAPAPIELPEEFPEDDLPEGEQHFGFENKVNSSQAFLVLAGLAVLVVVVVLILSRKY